MLGKQLFAKKSITTLLEEMRGENRLRRILGPIGLTSLGVGAIIGAGIFVMTGRTASVDSGPAVMVSYCVAGLGCALAALCYAEFASTVPVAGSAYTYAYATLGELMAWIIGWDLVLEYSMACAVVASGWQKYLNEFLKSLGLAVVPEWIASDPFTTTGAYFNLPAVAIMILVTIVLVIGIRESAATNALLVVVKLGVVLFVIGVGYQFIHRNYWTQIPVYERLLPEELLIEPLAEKEAKEGGKLSEDAAKARTEQIAHQARAVYRIEHVKKETAELVKRNKMTAEEAATAIKNTEEKFAKKVPQSSEDKAVTEKLLGEVRKEAPKKALEKWGVLGLLGLNQWLAPIDDSIRSPFAPYGLSGIMLGASLVFFAYIGFDSISTHSEEAIKPQRDVPFGIMASLGICTILYIAVSAVITGMEPYPEIDKKAAVAAAFRHLAEQPDQPNSGMLRAAGVLISMGALAGLTSVLLITFLSQARIFLAMARDGLLPPAIFGAIHPKFRTPHISTMLTGAVICVVGAFTPIEKLEEMVNIGTLMAFVIVCAAVLILRKQDPNLHRPFRCPLVWIVAPLGILVNFAMTLFLPWETWLRLVIWLLIGFVIYFFYGMRHSTIGKQIAAGTHV